MASIIQEKINRRREQLAKQNKKLKVKRVAYIRKPNAIELEYYQYLLHYVQRMRRKVETLFFPKLKNIVNEAINIKKDSYADDLLDALEKTQLSFLDEYKDKQVEEVVEKIGRKTSNFIKDELNRISQQAIGVDITGAEPWLLDELQAFTEDNVLKIRTISDRYFDDIKDIAFRGVREGTSYTEIKKQISAKYGATKWNAERIARDQVLTLHSQLNQTRQKKVGFKKYIWRDSNDNRVRASHENRDGKTYEWNKPPSGGHPGTEIMCRCFAEPDFEDLLQEQEKLSYLATEKQLKNVKNISSVPTILKPLSVEMIL
jgi:SPP1 gp7 family putative phage head morphogenesis protein